MCHRGGGRRLCECGTGVGGGGSVSVTQGWGV